MDFRNKDRNKPRQVISVNIKKNSLRAAGNRKEELGEELFGKLTGCNDLAAVEAVYHSACMKKFSKKTNSGKNARPANEEKACSFKILCEWLEKDGDCEIDTLQELFARMGELNSGNTGTYSEKSL